MTPAARLASAIDVLDVILDGASAEQTLTTWGRKNRYAGSKDRAAVRDHVFGCLRARASFAALGGALTGRGLIIGMLRSQGDDLDAVFNGQGYGPAALSEAEHAHVAGSVDPLPFDAPDWIAQQITADLGADAARVLAGYRDRAPVCLRVNTARAQRDSVARGLAADGIETRTVDTCATALIVLAGERKVKNHPLFLDGSVEVQDTSSQRACLALDLRPSDSVLDYCAGGGGKALAIAARGVSGINAYDTAPERMGDIDMRAARAGAEITVLGDPAQAAPFDVVLVDAPCSGSGTWRRAPQAKWALTQSDLAQFGVVQAEILAKAAPLASRILAYSTCSVFRAENEEQIDRFLSDNRDFECHRSERYPMDDSGDGFFLSQLIRKTHA